VKFVTPLSEAEQTTLLCAYHSGPKAAFRQRAHAILLSHKGYSIKEISDILAVHRDTLSGWIAGWEQEGLCGLRDKVRPGRPAIYNETERERLKELVDEQPHQLKAAQAKLQQETGKTSCTMTLKRYLKKNRV
jgi:transposase